MSIPTTMPAVVYKGKGELEVEDIPVPSVGPGEVLVEVSHCGVCGSDLHMILDGWGRKGSVEGHEWSGVVVAVGGGVTTWSVGDHIVGGPTPRCGECEPCRKGHPSLCSQRGTPGMGDSDQGAYARYMKTPENGILRIPDGLSLREAALAEPLAVALHGITKSCIEPGERALVLGAGPIGALTIAALRALGVDDIKVSEPGSLRQDLARRLGATVVVAPDELEVPGPYDPAGIVSDAVDVALECSGHGDAMEAGLAQLKRLGRPVPVGAGMAAAGWQYFGLGRGSGGNSGAVDWKVRKTMTKLTGSNHSGLFGAATGVSQSEPWFGAPRLLSVSIHAVLVALALVPWTAALPARPKLSETTVVLYTPSDMLMKPIPLPARAGGGGGGGKHQPAPASRGVLPRGADKQLAPPDPEPRKNPDPTLIVEPTIVAPQLTLLRPLNLLNIGDPNGIAGPPSSGPGDGGGIGT